MLLAMLTEPVDVHLVDDRFPWVPLLGDLALVLAALGGAWFAARWAARRLHEEIGADDQRFERQLQHDRDMRERDATRQVLDDVVEYVTRAIDAVSGLEAGVAFVEEKFDEFGAAGTDEETGIAGEAALQAQRDLAERMSPAAQAVIERNPTFFRLALRFPPDHPVVTTFKAWTDALNEWYRSLSRIISELPRTPEQREREQLQDQQLSEAPSLALPAFFGAARAWIQDTREGSAVD